MFDYIGTTELSDNEQFVGFNKNHKHYNLQKTDDISRCHHWFPREMTSEKWLQKFHLMTRHYRDMGNSSDWSCHGGNLPQPIRSTTQIWVVTSHQYRISALVSTSFGAETSGGAANCVCFLRLLPSRCSNRRPKTQPKCSFQLQNFTIINGIQINGKTRLTKANYSHWHFD